MSASTPTVSVIVPLHQAAETIVETLDSLREQGALELEVIVVDDRSSDGGPALARAHPLVSRVVPSRRAGLPGTRNTGLSHATGEFVVFLDADDLLLPGALESRVRAARAHPRAVIVTKHVELRDGAHAPMRLQRRADPDQRLRFLEGNQLAVHSALVPRALLPAGRAFVEEVRALEDWGLWLQLSLAGVPFVFVDVEDCVYRIRPGSLSADSRARQSDGLTILEHARRWIDAAPGGGHARLELRRRRTRHLWLRHRAWLALQERDLPAAAADLGRAVAASPEHCATIPLRALRRLARAVRSS